MDIGDLKTASESTGAQWVGEEVHGLPGVRFKVLPISAPEVQRFIGRAARRAGSEYRDANGIMTDEAFDRIEDDAIAKSALVDWDGLTDGGEALPHSHDKAAELLALPPFWTAVKNAINYVSGEAAIALERLAKNSKKPSRAKSKAA